MQLEVVNIEDVYPDKNNPRQKFEGIKELAASFDLNPERPGEPFIPPILVRDGGIYRIIDGERRYRALKMRKATHFTANVANTMDEANTLIAMVATNDKQPLSDIEKSRGVQQMLMLGVDPVVVNKAANIHDAKRVKRAMSLADDAAEDMSLDRLLALDEFEGNEQAIEAISNAKEQEWERVAAQCRKDIENQHKLEKLTDAIDELSIPIYDDEESLPSDYLYAARCTEVANIKKAASRYGASSCAAVVPLMAKAQGSSCYVCVNIFHKTKGQEDSEQAELKKKSDEIKALIANSEQRIKEFIGTAAHQPASHVSAYALDGFLERYGATLHTAEELFDGLALDTNIKAENPVVFVLGMTFLWHSAANLASFISKGQAPKWFKDQLDDRKRLITALLADGYQPTEDERYLFDMTEKVVFEND